MFFNLKFEVAVGFGSCKLSKLRTRGLVYKTMTFFLVNFGQLSGIVTCFV
jgi:hypothetical protein